MKTRIYYQNLQDAEKAVFRDTLIVLSAYIRKERRFKNQSSKFPPQETKEEKIKPK